MPPDIDGTPDARVFLPATHDGIRAGLAEIKTMLAPLSLSVEEWGSIELVVAEALNNVAEHAYAGRTDGHAEVRLFLASNGVRFLIEDQGDPMPDGTMPLGMANSVDLPVDDLPEGGFGWFMIHQIARDLDYDRRADVNRLSFRIAVDAGVPLAPR